ncbi:hypothetical protein [Teredinibacter franksiae]|uniref:hypothetical protein n=1 Tax=Teredinibacter franksiae TaxID=2761453 RepID=UPI0016257FEA|nr:hypothetical protein [Teredinibacter franksiae]
MFEESKGVRFGLYVILVFGVVVFAMPTWAAPKLILADTSTSWEYNISVSKDAYTFQIQEKQENGVWKTIVDGNYYNYGPFNIVKSKNNVYYYKLKNWSQNGTLTTHLDSINVQKPLPKPAVPTLSLATTDSDGTYTVSWSKPTHTTNFILYEQKQGGNWGKSEFVASITSRLRPGMADGVWNYRIEAANGNAFSGASGIKSIKVARIPGVPSSIETPGTNDGSYTIGWNGSSGSVTSYELERLKVNTPGWVAVYSGLSRQKSFPSIAAGTYRHRVKACNNVSGYEPCSSWKYSSGSTVVAKPSSSPSIDLASTDSDGSYTVYWNSIGNTKSYILQEKKVGDSNWFEYSSTTATQLSIPPKGSSTYIYRVKACNDIGCSGYSGSKEISVAIAPGTPPSIDTPPTNDGDYIITWGSASGSPNRYRLYYKKSSASNWTNIYTGSNKSYSFEGLSAGTYSHKVAACRYEGSYENCSGEKASGNTVVAAPNTVPVITLAGSDSDGSYPVSWNSISNSTSYDLRQNINGGSFSQAQNSGATTKGYSSQLSRRYGYKVRACNNIGCTGYSGVSYINVAVKPGMPSSITPPGTSNGEHTVSWGAASGEVHYYQLEYRRSPDTKWSLAYTGDKTSETFTVPSAGVYEHRVRACVSAGGLEACSSERTATLKTKVIKPVDITYQYDPLGRLVKVKEDGSTKTGYCYDPAGNRTALKESGGGEDCPAPSSPDKPTGLAISTPAPNMYIASWGQAPGSSHYIFKYTDEIGETTMTINGGRTTEITIVKDPQAYPPIYLQACNQFGCSSSVSF